MEAGQLYAWHMVEITARLLDFHVHIFVFIFPSQVQFLFTQPMACLLVWNGGLHGIQLIIFFPFGRRVSTLCQLWILYNIFEISPFFFLS